MIRKRPPVGHRHHRWSDFLVFDKRSRFPIKDPTGLISDLGFVMLSFETWLRQSKHTLHSPPRDYFFSPPRSCSDYSSRNFVASGVPYSSPL